MIRRSSIIAVLVAMTVSVASADATSKALSKSAAKAKTMQVISQERANKYGARKLIGGPFTVSYNTCVAQTAVQARCSYYIKSVNPVDTSGVEPKYRLCTVGVTVKKGRSGKVTRRRGRPGCIDRERFVRP